MSATLALVRRNAYVDSVTLLQVTAEVAALTGIAEAALVMATDLNRDGLRDAGLLVGDAAAAGANDLVLAVRATDEAAASAAIQQAESLLARRRTSSSSATEVPAPRSLRSAHRADPEARLAVISVPGQYAAGEARQALAEGLNVFLFSDNVPIEDEVDLKRYARERGLFVMGPDCGTAILNGIGLGFANVVRRGRIGIVAASGTGIQEVSSLLHQWGSGISHAIGTGGRDLHREVGGITTLQAIRLLRDDLQTERIVLLSKPADPEIAGTVLQSLAETGKRVVAYLQGRHVRVPDGVMAAGDLEEAAIMAMHGRPRGAARRFEALPRDASAKRVVRGLFCGGTLREEAAAILPRSEGHELIDFGDDEYTRGRAHPMIDPTLRNQAIVHAGAASDVAVVLLDVILGLGSHPDPAGATAPAIKEAIATAAAARRPLAVLAHIVGTDADPQDLARQTETLRAAGAQVLLSNYKAAQAASRMVERVAV